MSDHESTKLRAFVVTGAILVTERSEEADGSRKSQ